MTPQRDVLQPPPGDSLTSGSHQATWSPTQAMPRKAFRVNWSASVDDDPLPRQDHHKWTRRKAYWSRDSLHLL